MNNDILDIRRFSRYFAADIKNCIAHLGWTSLATSLIGLTVYLFTGSITTLLGYGWYSTGIVTRVLLFAMVITIVVITGPERLYGKWTDPKTGRFHMTLPVSSFEKTASMILNATVLLPLLTACAYLAVDALICLIDSNCGASIIGTIANGLPEVAVPLDYFFESNNYKSLLNPMLYIDDIIQSSLIFLLGTVIFKKNKTIKTILCLIGLSMALSMISTPIVAGIFNGTSALWTMNPESFADKFSWLVRNGAVIDTISDTIVNCVLAGGIFYRVRTMKF